MKKYTMMTLLSVILLPFVAGVLLAADTDNLTPQQREEAMVKIIMQREATQTDRIANDYASGKLTEAEKARLQKQLDKINQDFQTMKASDPGLTPKEFVQLQHELNKNSAAIYRLNHNENTHAKVGKPTAGGI